MSNPAREEVLRVLSAVDVLAGESFTAAETTYTATMNQSDTDTLYFGAIESARTGRIDGRAMEMLLSAARKFVAVDLLEESARSFERLYQILQTALSNGYQPNHNQVEYFKSMIEEYCALLSRMERHERRQVVRAVLADLERPDAT